MSNTFRFQILHATFAELSAVNPLLKAGEPVVTTDVEPGSVNRVLKIGDGLRHWVDLPSFYTGSNWSEEALEALNTLRIEGAGFVNISQAWAESATSPDDTDSKSAKTWAGVAEGFAALLFDTIALMAASDTLTDGDKITVWSGDNGQKEGFEYDASSTLTPDGTLIVDPTGMGSVGRLVSTRTVYSEWAELNTDTRVFPVATDLIVLGVGGFNVVDTGADITFSGGIGVVIKNAPVTPQHFGCPIDGVSDCQPAVHRMADWMAARPAAVGVKFPPNITYVFNSQVRFDNPERSFMDLTGARIEWDFDGRCFDMNKDASDQLPITTTADTYTKRDQYIYGGDFHYTGPARTDAYAIQAFYMRGFFWSDFYVQGARGCAIFGGKDTYRFSNFRTFDCIRYFETPEEGVLHAAALTGNDLIDVVIDGQIAGPSTAEWGVYFGARTMSAQVKGNINGNFTAGHVKVKDGSVIASRGVFMAFRSEQLENTRVAVDMDASRGTGFLNVTFADGMEISGLNGWYGFNLNKCVGVRIGNVIFLDGSGAGVSTERAIYIDNDCRDVRIDTETTLFTGVAAGREIVLESPTARENITLTPEIQWLDFPLIVTGYDGVVTHASKSVVLDVEANILLPANRVPLLPPKGWVATMQYRTATPGGVNTSGAFLKQSNEAETSWESLNEGLLMWSGAMPANFVFAQSGMVRANDNGNLWVRILSPGSDAIIHIRVSGFCQ